MMNNLVRRVIKLLSYAEQILDYFVPPDNFFFEDHLTLSSVPCSWQHGNVLLARTFPATPLWNAKLQ